MKKTILVLLVTFITFLGAKAQYDDNALKVLDAMSAKYKEMPAFNTVFKYTLENPTENLKEVFEGKVTVKGNKYKLNMEGQEIINDGKTVWTYLPDLNEVNISTYSAEDQDISLNNIFTLYKSGYKYLYIEQLNNGTLDVVDLVPEDKNNTYFKIRLTIGSNDKLLKSFLVFDKNGNRFLYDIQLFTVDTTVTDKFFTFDPAKYPGVEVLDYWTKAF
jgi:outer membrane lipoprotein carrier protein